MKLQPNFSWQTYQHKPEDQHNQFQKQLQQMHIVTANSVNATIDDASFWLRERQTGFTWVDGKPLYTKTVATTAWTAGGTVNTIPLGIVGNFTVRQIECVLSDGALSTSTSVPVPYIDVAVAANSIQLVRVGTNVVLTSGGTNYSAYSGYVTVYYTKT